MGISKRQKLRFIMVCQCGCGRLFTPFPVYKKGVEGLVYPRFMVGHNPRSKETRLAGDPWNKGLKKGDHPSLERMGFQPGHEPYNDWSKVNQALSSDPDLRARWLHAKRRQVPWNKGLEKSKYPNGIKSGEQHGNWCGNHRGPKDLALMKALAREVLERDNFTCQHCGDHNRRGRGSRCRLEVHHIVAIAEDHTLAFEKSNLVTLCADCHRKTDNYGTKVVNKLKKQAGK